MHAWMFFIGFVLFPLWWIAGFLVGIPKTRVFGAGEAEKGVILDDPQVEHGMQLYGRTSTSHLYPIQMQFRGETDAES